MDLWLTLDVAAALGMLIGTVLRCYRPGRHRRHTR